jgi:hypothetical protein
METGVQKRTVSQGFISVTLDDLLEVQFFTGVGLVGTFILGFLGCECSHALGTSTMWAELHYLGT